MPRDRDDDRYDDEDRPRRPRRDDYEDDDRPRRSRRRDDDDYPPPKKGISGGMIALIVVGVLALLGIPIIAIMIGLLLPAMQKVREAASRQQSTNNLNQVGIAMHSHHDVTWKLHGPFADPPPGSPPSALPSNLSDRLSWRAAILPYIEHDNVYKQLKFDQPWNSPANTGPANIPIRPYCDPLDGPASANTRIRCFYDNGALFDSDPRQRVGLSGVTDGASNTIAYVESADLMPWAQFNEYLFNPNGALPNMGHPQRNFIMIVMADGSVRTVKKTVNPQSFKAAITRTGDEVLPPGWDQ
jgi:hypothetical protein